jgi:hypothetical protein
MYLPTVAAQEKNTLFKEPLVPVIFAYCRGCY